MLAAAYRLSIPVTIHTGIGYDILHEHPNCDGDCVRRGVLSRFSDLHAHYGATGRRLRLSFGSAIMGPEVYLKALAMVAQRGASGGPRASRDFTTAVFDIWPIRGDFHHELPKTDPGYYFRPHKTILVRTVADGGAEFLF